MSEVNQHKMVAEIFELQDNLNKSVNENWIELNREWYRAIWIECSELMDKITWKWWKHGEPEKSQAFLEMVDIFHFGISDIIQKHGNNPDTIAKTNGAISNTLLILTSDPNMKDVSKEKLLKLIEKFALETLKTETFDIQAFVTVLFAMGYTFTDMHLSYIAKNVLNKFRQDNGYKTGEYEKIWMGLEDNVHLENIIDTLKTVECVDSTSETIYNTLDKVYEKHLTSTVSI